MKLYLFKPSEKWRYCGGVIAVISPSFEEVQKVLDDHDQGDEKVYYAEIDVPDDGKNWSKWVVVESFEVQGELPRIVINDYNWG